MPLWSYTSLTSGRKRYPGLCSKSLRSLSKMMVSGRFQASNGCTSYAAGSGCMDFPTNVFSRGHGHYQDCSREQHCDYNNIPSHFCTAGVAPCDDFHNPSDAQRGLGNRLALNCRTENDQCVSNDEIHLQLLVNNGQLDKALAMLSHFVTPISDASYLSLLKACSRNKSLTRAKQVRDHIGQHRPQLAGLLGDYLVVTLATCGAADTAYDLATTLPSRTVFSWSAIVTAYADSDRGQEAIQMLQQMQEEHIQPNNYTYVGLLKACGSISDLEKGQKLHSDACKHGYVSDLFVDNTLVSMYAKCGAVLEAGNVFEALAHRDVVSWNAMLAAYTEEGDGVKALKAYEQMHKDGINVDAHTLAIALQACIAMAERDEGHTLLQEAIKGLCLEIGRALSQEAIKGLCLEIGQALHADLLKMESFASDIVIGNTLVSMYCKCGTIPQAEGMFARLPKHDTVSWNAMLSGFLEHNQAEKCLQLYKIMQDSGQTPDQLTLVFALQACGILAEKEEASMVDGLTNRTISLKLGRALHSDVCSRGFASDIIISNALVTMYSKCGSFGETEDLFTVLSHRDTVSWNALLSACVEQGLGVKALHVYRKMQREQVALDDLTLVCGLQACSETGSLILCKQLHFNIVTADYDGMASVATTLINSYANCASISDSKYVFDSHREPDVVTWNALITGYGGNGLCLSGLCLYEESKMVGIKPVEASFTAALLACAHCGLGDEGACYFVSMRKDEGISASLKHFNIMVDLSGRAGAFEQVEGVLLNMPMQPDLTLWLSLLGACRTHSNVPLARHVFAQAVKLQPKHPTAYVLMSTIYSDAGCQESAAEVELYRQRQRAWKKSGQKWDAHGREMEAEHEKLPRGMVLCHMLHQ